jgi:hypothetical protein
MILPDPATAVVAAAACLMNLRRLLPDADLS